MGYLPHRCLAEDASAKPWTGGVLGRSTAAGRNDPSAGGTDLLQQEDCAGTNHALYSGVNFARSAPMSKLLRGVAAGWGAKKLGGGCLSTIVVFALLWYLLGHFQIFR